MKASQLDLDARELFAQPRFRRFLLQVANQSGIFSPTAGAAESLQYREGMRSLGLDIFRTAARGTARGTIEEVIVAVLSEATPKETRDEASEHPESDRD